ncbi:MAG: futalosine hydrolase [Thermodesulfovibrionales bacterium]|nr:futalosine hydrolase [Thermodesulfovibrionales bacterium]
MSKIIAIIASVEFELSLIQTHLGVGGFRFHEPVKKGEVILYLSGIGMVNAAIAATRVIDSYSPSLIISTGICGAYRESGLNIGDIALAEKEIYGDTGVIGGRDFQDLKALGLPVIKISSSNIEIFNEIPIRNSHKHKIYEICKELSLNLQCGSFVTVSGITGNPEIAEKMHKRWNAICENMEGAAVAHAALINNIDFMEIRGVSNIAGERDKSRWNPELASKNCQGVLMEFIKWYLNSNF